MVDDAIGELCNMIVGGWKSKLDTSVAVCLISIPTITRADSARFKDALHTTTTFNRSYSFQGNVFGIVLGL
jgi:chemotaxis protein CheX